MQKESYESMSWVYIRLFVISFLLFIFFIYLSFENKQAYKTI